jgi:hexokinase
VPRKKILPYTLSDIVNVAVTYSYPCKNVKITANTIVKIAPLMDPLLLPDNKA